MSTAHDDTAPPASPDTVTTADLDLVERLDREATPGPWEITRSRSASDTDVDAPDGTEVATFWPQVGRTWSNAELTATARTLLPRLARAYHDVVVDRRAWRTVATNRRHEIETLKSAIEDAYARGRREAIEEAIKVLGEWTGERMVLDGFAGQLRDRLARGGQS